MPATWQYFTYDEMKYALAAHTRETLQLLRIDRLSCGETVHDNADPRSVRFSENTDAQIFSEFRGHDSLLS